MHAVTSRCTTHFQKSGWKCNFSILKKHSSSASEKDVAVIVIDMPLTELNRKQMSEGAAVDLQAKAPDSDAQVSGALV